MTWFNEYDIDDALVRHRHHHILGPATETLSNLRHVVNHNSDGWAYWNPPVKAAERLMKLIQGDPRDRFSDRTDVTVQAVKAAYTPIKAFLTRYKLTSTIVEPCPTPEAWQAVLAERANEADRRARANRIVWSLTAADLDAHAGRRLTYDRLQIEETDG